MTTPAHGSTGGAGLETLGGFSTRFAARLFEARPDLRRFAEARRRAGDDEDHLVLRVPAPPGSRLNPGELFVTTQGHEVTVGLGHWHAHFDWPQSPGEDDVIHVIGALLDEEIMLVSYWKHGRVRSGGLLRRSEAPREQPGFAIRIRSWTGLLDADHQR